MNAKLKSLLRERGLGQGGTTADESSGVEVRRDGGSRKGKGTRKPGGAAAAQAAPKDGVVRVGRETKGRKGKGVTLVTGVPLSGAALDALGKELKNLCGAGGTLKDGVIEIQGDHRDRIIPALEKRGWTVKRVGG
jgi:translation initiation factor 1